MTTVGSNFNLQELQAMLGQSGLSGLSGQSITLNNGQTINIGELLNGTGYVEQMFAPGGSAAKVNGIQGVVNFAFSIFDKLATNEAKTARKEVSKQTKDIDKLKEQSEQTAVDLRGSFEEIASDVEKHIEVVDQANEMLVSTQKDIEEQQKAIQEVVEKIAQAKEALAQETDPNRQAQLLQEIDGYITEISNIGISIQDHANNLKDLTETVANTSESIDEATEKMDEVVKFGFANIADGFKQIQVKTGEVANTGIKAGQNKATATAARTQAEALSSNPATATAGAQLYKVSFDQDAAGTNRLQSIGSNMTSIASGLNEIADSSAIVESYQNTIGSALFTYQNSFGAWESSVEPLIQGFGSYANFATALDELNTAIDTDMGNLGNSNQYAQDDTKKADSANTQQSVNNTNENNTEEPKNNLETSKFDVENRLKFDFGFGI